MLFVCVDDFMGRDECVLLFVVDVIIGFLFVFFWFFCCRVVFEVDGDFEYKCKELFGVDFLFDWFVFDDLL